jgi:tetratricopeptide (TPR) repeat protein
MKATTINPKYDQAYNNFGNAFYDLKLYDKAIWAYNIAIEINPSNH